jgi:hypothetical protein
MDGDGEDRPVEIKSLVNEVTKNTNISVVAKRVKRSEGSLFSTFISNHIKLLPIYLLVKK